MAHLSNFGVAPNHGFFLRATQLAYLLRTVPDLASPVALLANAPCSLPYIRFYYFSFPPALAPLLPAPWFPFTAYPPLHSSPIWGSPLSLIPTSNELVLVRFICPIYRLVIVTLILTISSTWLPAFTLSILF